MKYILSFLLLFSIPAYGETVYHYLNSLTDYSGGDGPGYDDDTKVPNWVARMAAYQGHEYHVGGEFGFLPNWETPPRYQNGYADANQYDHSGWQNVYDVIYFTPDNFIMPSQGPFDGVFGGQSYVEGLDRIINSWEVNTSGDKTYKIYLGWPAPDHICDNILQSCDLQAYYTWGLGEYGEWWDQIVNVLNQYTVGVDLVDVNTALLTVMQLPELSGMSLNDWFVDSSPHGTETTYLVAAMATYIDLYQEPVPTGWHPDQSAGVNNDLLVNLQLVKNTVAGIILDGNVPPPPDPIPDPIPDPLDTDGDGVEDSVDNCPVDYNSSQTDTDGDGIGNACDFDVSCPPIPDPEPCPVCAVFPFSQTFTLTIPLDVVVDGVGEITVTQP